MADIKFFKLFIMKKKNLTGKLSLKKSRISALDSSKIKGGTSVGSGPTPNTQVFCIISRDTYGCVTQDATCTLSADTGSECKCL